VIGLVLTVKIKLTGNAPKLKQHQSLFRSTDGQPEIAIWRQTQTRSTCISDSELKLLYSVENGNSNGKSGVSDPAEI